MLGLVLLVAGITKLQFPLEFLSGVYAYRVVGEEIGLMTAMVLPWLEFWLGIFLILDVLTVESLVVTAALMGGFVGLQIYAIASGLVISCSCFGAANGGEPVGWSSTGRTAGVFAVALIILIGAVRHRAREAPAG